MEEYKLELTGREIMFISLEDGVMLAVRCPGKPDCHALLHDADLDKMAGIITVIQQSRRNE